MLGAQNGTGDEEEEEIEDTMQEDHPSDERIEEPERERERETSWFEPSMTSAANSTTVVGTLPSSVTMAQALKIVHYTKLVMSKDIAEAELYLKRNTGLDVHRHAVKHLANDVWTFKN